MALWAIPLAMAAISAAAEMKKQGDQKKQKQLDQLFNAQDIRYSPWTKRSYAVNEQQVDADPLGKGIAGGVSGIGLDQNIDAANREDKFNEAYMNYLNRKP